MAAAGAEDALAVAGAGVAVAHALEAVAKTGAGLAAVAFFVALACGGMAVVEDLDAVEFKEADPAGVAALVRTGVVVVVARGLAAGAEKEEVVGTEGRRVAAGPGNVNPNGVDFGAVPAVLTGAAVLDVAAGAKMGVEAVVLGPNRELKGSDWARATTDASVDSSGVAFGKGGTGG